MISLLKNGKTFKRENLKMSVFFIFRLIIFIKYSKYSNKMLRSVWLSHPEYMTKIIKNMITYRQIK